MKKIVFTLPENAAGSLLHALCRQLPLVPEYHVKQALKNKDVKQNGERMRIDSTCKAGAEVMIFLPDEAIIEIPILYENERIIAVHKPYGISCVPDAHGAPCLAELLHSQLVQNDPSARMPIICHRLDNQTEGAVLLAKDEDAAFLLQDAFRNHQIEKTYECLVKGRPQPAHAILQDYLIKDACASRVKIARSFSPNAKLIITEYEVLEYGEISRLRVLLHTGRTHQIRAHLAHYGYPLLGDDQYGDRSFNKAQHAKHLALCSVRLAFHTTGALASLCDVVITTAPHF